MGILLGQTRTGVGHGELTLCLVEDYPSASTFDKGVQGSGEYGRHADVSQAEHVRREWLSRPAVVYEVAYLRVVPMVVAAEV